MTSGDNVAPNAIGAALGLLGDEWSLLIVQQCFLRVRRFSAMQVALGASPGVLSARLSGLVESNVLVKAADDYRLTKSGLDLWSLLLCIWAWEQRWVQGEALPSMRHGGCGDVFAPVLSCASCSDEVRRADLDIARGPSGDGARSTPTGRRRRRAGTTRVDGPGLFPETMALIGNRWSAAVLGAAFLGARRFRDFEAELGAPPAIVSERLRQFVAQGVLDADYALTEKGDDFFVAASQLVAWGERWCPSPDGPSLEVTHRDCGAAFIPTLRCSACGDGLTRRTVSIEHRHHASPALALSL